MITTAAAAAAGEDNNPHKTKKRVSGGKEEREHGEELATAIQRNNSLFFLFFFLLFAERNTYAGKRKNKTKQKRTCCWNCAAGVCACVTPRENCRPMKRVFSVRQNTAPICAAAQASGRPFFLSLILHSASYGQSFFVFRNTATRGTLGETKQARYMDLLFTSTCYLDTLLSFTYFFF